MTPQERSGLYRATIQEMEEARTKGSPAATIGQLARQAGEKYAQTEPGLAVNIQFSAVVMLQMKVAGDPETRSLILELKARQRQLLDSVPLPERLWRLSSQPLPLNMEFSAKTGEGGRLETWTELEYLFRNWRQSRDGLGETQHHEVAFPHSRPWPPPGSVQIYTNAAGVVVIPDIDQYTPPDRIRDPILREQYQRALADYEEKEKRRGELSELWRSTQLFTNAVIRQISLEYKNSPHLVAQLQEIMDGYLPPADSTNIMNKVFAAMPAAVAAKTPRPVPGAKGERWLRTEAPAPRPEPGLPAIAKPSRIREGSQGIMGAVSPGAAVAGAEPVGSGGGAAGGRVLWPWVALGVGAVVAAWVWLRQRG